MENIDLARTLVKGSIPFIGTARRLKRKIIPYQPDPANSGFAFDDGVEMLLALREAGIDSLGSLLEVGSGWTPIVPLLFHIAGATEVTLTDLERLYDLTSNMTAAKFVYGRLSEVIERLNVDATKIRKKIGSFSPGYICPWRSERHPAASVDLAISRAVMEHVRAEAVEGLFAGLRRVVRPGGFTCHLIDNSDHWQHGDGKGSLVDFLRYPSDSVRWRLASKNAYTNRFRHSDYLAALERSGWTVILERSRVPPEILADVKFMKAKGEMAPEFAGRDPQDLAAIASLIVARRVD